jgi:hypothetical protein
MDDEQQTMSNDNERRKLNISPFLGWGRVGVGVIKEMHA